jgi:hypothetical protein
MRKGLEPSKDVAVVGCEIEGGILKPGKVLLDEMWEGSVGYRRGCHRWLVMSCCRSPVTVVGCCRCFLTAAILYSRHLDGVSSTEICSWAAVRCVIGSFGPVILLPPYQHLVIASICCRAGPSEDPVGFMALVLSRCEEERRWRNGSVAGILLYPHRCSWYPFQHTAYPP